MKNLSSSCYFKPVLRLFLQRNTKGGVLVLIVFFMQLQLTYALKGMQKSGPCDYIRSLMTLSTFSLKKKCFEKFVQYAKHLLSSTVNEQFL